MAAGVAAAYGINNKMSFRQISQDEEAIASIQQTLKEQGAYLESWPQVQEAVEQHWAYSGVKRCAVWHWYMAVIKMIIG